LLLDTPTARADISIAIIIVTAVAAANGLLISNESPAIHLKLG